jgi:hypothetical protein
MNIICRKVNAFTAIVLVLLMAMPVKAHSETLLTEDVAQLDKHPQDEILREKIIRKALEANPRIPEEARRAFIEGTTITKSAKSAKGQTLAIESFSEALKIAPWWGDAYYNLAVAQELAGKFEAAQTSLKFYILTNPGGREAREAKNRIYALEAKTRLISAEAEKFGTRNKENDTLPKLDGATFVNQYVDAGGTLVYKHTITVQGKSVTRSSWSIGQPVDKWSCTLRGLRCNLCCGEPGTIGGEPGARVELQISKDGGTATTKFFTAEGKQVDTIRYERK